MKRPSWDETWLDVAKVVAKRSLCDRSKVGAVLVDNRNRVAATGYNSPHAGFNHGGEGCLMWCQRARINAITVVYGSSCPSLHAEANTLLYVSRDACEGGTMYSTRPPCWDCAKLLTASGVTAVVALVSEVADAHLEPGPVRDHLLKAGMERVELIPW